jgi:hypothetical protein
MKEELKEQHIRKDEHCCSTNVKVALPIDENKDM